MTINNNLSSMLSIQMDVNQMAQNVAQVANSIGDPALQEVAGDIVDSIVQQTPATIAYSANAQGIATKQAVMDTILDIKA